MYLVLSADTVTASVLLTSKFSVVTVNDALVPSLINGNNIMPSLATLRFTHGVSNELAGLVGFTP